MTHTDSPRGPSLVGTRVFFCSRDWTLSTSPISMAFSSFSSFLFHSDSWKYKTSAMQRQQKRRRKTTRRKTCPFVLVSSGYEICFLIMQPVPGPTTKIYWHLYLHLFYVQLLKLSLKALKKKSFFPNKIYITVEIWWENMNSTFKTVLWRY